MKVVQINAVCEFGSTGRIVCELSDYLNECAVENKIYYGSGMTTRENASYIGTKQDHKLHAFFSRLTGLQGYFSRKATRKLLKEIKILEPDIVHLHNLHSNYINLPILFKFLAKENIAVVITLHDCFFYTGKCVYYTIANCNRWQKACGKCPQLKRGNKSWFFDRTKAMLQDKRKWFSNISNLGIIGVSKWVTEEAKKSVVMSNAKMKTIYNWIDLETFVPHESDIKEKLGIKDKFLILGVSIDWSTNKGVDDFNRLAEMLDDRFQIVLVGKSQSQLNEKIMHIDRTDNIQMMSDLYAAADVFYNPSKRETFGKVTAEALACGTPVVVYNTSACTELVGEGCGFVVDRVGDVETAYKYILIIAESGQDYIENCRAFAECCFDKKLLLAETMNFYEELLNGERE